MLQVKFRLKFKRALASGLNNTLWTLKFHSIHICLFKRVEKRMILVLLEEEMCVGAFMAGKVPSGWVTGRNPLQWWVPTHWVCTKVPPTDYWDSETPSQKIVVISPAWLSGSVVPDPRTSQKGALCWVREQRLSCSLGSLLSRRDCSTEACNRQYYFFWKLRKISSVLSWKSEMNVSSVSSNEVPEVEEGLLSSEDIKRHNF